MAIVSRGCRTSTFSGVGMVSRRCTQCVWTDTGEVQVALRLDKVTPNHSENSLRIDWVMYLQRNQNGVWVTVGERTGYVSASSPSDRTFTNVATKGTLMRVRTYFKSPVYQSIISPQWMQ